MIKQLNVLTSDKLPYYDAIKEAFGFMLVNSMDKAKLETKDGGQYNLELNFNQAKNTISGKFSQEPDTNDE